MAQLETLLELLTTHGGRIISSESLQDYEIEQAEASGRIHIDSNSFGFVWEPDIMGFPTTEEGVDFFERYYPLNNIEVPEGIFDRVMNKVKEIAVNNTINCTLPGVDLIGCPLIHTDCKTCKYK